MGCTQSAHAAAAPVTLSKSKECAKKLTKPSSTNDEPSDAGSTTSTDEGALSMSETSSSGLRITDRVHPEMKTPVKLVVFDFDETLTLGSFLPKASTPSTVKSAAKLSFDSPYLPGGNRRALLAKLFTGLIQQGCKLAVLSYSTGGALSIVRLMESVGLAKYFSAVWCMVGRNSECMEVVVKSQGSWQLLPKPEVASTEKPDLLVQAIRNWLPDTPRLRLDEVLMVDDNAGNFESKASGLALPRCCLVSRFNAEFMGMGVLNLGGLGAQHVGEFDEVLAFVTWTNLSATP